jgi:hypothetical protein
MFELFDSESQLFWKIFAPRIVFECGQPEFFLKKFRSKESFWEVRCGRCPLSTPLAPPQAMSMIWYREKEKQKEKKNKKKKAKKG